MPDLGSIGFKASGYQTSEATLVKTRLMLMHDRSELIFGVITKASAFGKVSLMGAFFDLDRANPADYSIPGIVKERGVAVQRTIRMYRRDNGALMAEVTSAADGTFELPSVAYNGLHYVIALDDDTGTQYEPLIFDRLTPA